MTWHGPQQKGAKRILRELKRAEAEARQKAYEARKKEESDG